MIKEVEMLIRQLFLRMGKEKNYIVLPEVSLVRENQDTYYIGSAVMAHMHLFEKQHLTKESYVATQRIFSSKRLQEIGKYPLTTTFEVMLSMFRFGDTDGREALRFAIDFVCEAINGDPSKLIFLAPYELGLRKDVLSLGISSNRVISWDQSLETSLGDGRPTGYYVKMFYPYRHGIIPIGSIGFIESNGKLSVDSAFFMERLSFVREGLPTFYQDRYFAPLMNMVNNHEFFADLSFYEKNLWINHMRSIVALLVDGATFNAKGAGHALKKMVRQLAVTIVGKKLPDELGQKLILAANQCLFHMGYLNVIEYKKLSEIVVAQINLASNQISKEKKAFIKALRSNKNNMSIEELQKWNSERGLRFEWLDKFALQEGVSLPCSQEIKRHQFRNECYSFSETDRIKDPIQYIKDSENQKMKGRLIKHG
jgi:alanyl-tRNA synthetase